MYIIGNQISTQFAVKSDLKQGNEDYPHYFSTSYLTSSLRKQTSTECQKRFLEIERESQKVDLKINEDQTKYMHVTHNNLRNRVGQDVTI